MNAGFALQSNPTPYSALRELLAAAGLPMPSGDSVAISGSDPVVRTRFRVGTLAAAAHAAIGVAVAELWKLQTGRGQRVGVDLRAASAALFMYKYTFLDGKRLHEIQPPDPFLRCFPARDGRWIRLLTSFPEHRAAALEVLGDPANPAEAAKATAAWDALELEEKLLDAGACAAFLRTAEEWQAHPQFAAVSALPPFEIERIGDAPVEPLPAGSRPLSGVRVLDLTRVVAGPACGRVLAEHGADVLKINGAHLHDQGPGELDSGLGKLSATLDLRTNEGVETLRELVRDTDVFSQGYRPGALRALGFSPQDAARLRPGIVYAELSAWGRNGPWSGRRGFDSSIQAATGMIHVPDDGSTPVAMPVTPVDYLAGYFLALGVIAALRRRAVEGGSWLVRTSLAQSGHWIASHGMLDAADIAALPADMPADEIARRSMETQSPAGLVRHLKPVVELSETAPRWERPPVPIGHHPPVWPARGS